MSDTPEYGETEPTPKWPPTPDNSQPGPYGQPAPYGQPPAADLRAVSGPAPVLVSFPAPAPQARVTVAFRALLVIPHLIVLWALGIAAGIVVVISWFAAVFTGQMPRWAHVFVTGYLRWTTRVYAYLFFLTDQYPPFSLEDDDYPVRLLTKQARLSRLAVVFRYFLMIPVGLVSQVAYLGLAVLSVFAWVIALVTGGLPRPLHEAFAAIVRFSARYNGYANLLTPEYPAGLFGDRGQPAAEAGLATADAPWLSAPWRLLLSQGAKVLVAVSLVLGVAGYIAWIVVGISAASGPAARAAALASVNADYSKLNNVFIRFQSQTKACTDVSCVTALDRQVAQALRTFGTGISNAGVPSAYSAQANALSSDASALRADFRRLATAQSVAQYQSIVRGLSLQADVSRLQSDYTQLASGLANG
jgi:Domain of unknown function (DUF4389)